MAATIEVNSMPIERIRNQRSASIATGSSSSTDARSNCQLLRYRTMGTRLEITAAHELEHAFTSYMLEDPRVHSPPVSSHPHDPTSLKKIAL